MPFVLRPPTDRSLTTRLADLGAARRRAAVAAGLFRLVALTLVAVTAVCLLDAAVHLPGYLRAVGLAGIVAGAGVLFRRWVLAASRRPSHPLAVALELEDRYPDLNDSLASSVDFMERSAADPLGRFQRVAILRAENLAKRHDLRALVPARAAWGGFWLVALLAAAVAPLVAVAPERAAHALLRLADPFGSHPWPTRTTLTVLEPTRSLLAKGDPFVVKATVGGAIPEQLTVSVRLAGGGPVDETVAVAPPGDGHHQSLVEVKLDPSRVPRDFDFRVTAGDADTGWRPITVAPPPQLVPANGRPSPQVGLTFPAYTDLKPVELPDGTGVVEAVAGTVVRFRAAADRRIVDAAFHYQGTDAGLVQVAATLAPLAGDGPLSRAAATALAGHYLTPIPVRVSGADGTDLSAEFVPPLPGLYALRFADPDGLTGTRLFDFRMFTDPSPITLLDRPSRQRDPLLLLPTATLSVIARAEDRPFASRSLWVEYRVGGPEVPYRPLPLADHATAGRLLPALTGAAVGPLTLKVVNIEGQRSVRIASLLKPDGSKPGDGDVITLRAAADDWDTRTALKPPGRSPEVDIHILNKESLEAVFQKELSELRPELLRMREELRSAQASADEAAKNAAKGDATAEEASKLAKAEQAARQARNQVGDAAEGMRARAERLRDTARANQLPRTPTVEKVEGVAGDFAKLGDEHLDAAATDAAAARQQAEKAAQPNGAKPDPKAVAAAADKAARELKAAEGAVGGLLEKLEQWGGAGEVRGEARALKDQVQKAGSQADRTADKVPAGTTTDKLTPADAAELAAAAEKFDQAADQAAGLMNKAARLAVEKDAQAAAARAAAADAAKAAGELAEQAASEKAGSAARDRLDAAAATARAEAARLGQNADRAKAEADALRKGVQQAGGQAIPDDLRRAADDLRNNRPAESAAARQKAIDRLDKLASELSEKPTQTADELRKKRKESADAVDKLAAEQDELRKKTEKAAAEGDPETRSAELQKLGREQERLQKEAEKLAERLTREQADPSADAVRQAARQMDAARQELERGNPPTGKQEEALEKLDDAADRLDADRQKAEQQLSREKREQLAEVLKAIRERQKAAVDEAARVQGAAAEAKQWDRPLLASLGDLEDREKNLAGELRAFTEKQLADLPVFAKLAGQSAAAMERAAKLVVERRDDAATADRFDPETEKVSDDRLNRPLKLALRRLDQILDTLAEDPNANQPQAGGGGGAGDGEGGEGGGRDGGGGIPQLAQLKALRAMQAEVAEQTAAFARAYPDPDKLTADQKDELKELEQAQRDVADLFEKLAPLFRQKPELP
jgi:hypothetical protein